MALIEEERIIIPGENGEENLYEVIFTFDIEDNDQSYVAVVPVEQSEDEEQEVFVFRYEEKDNQDDLMLFSIESDEEWDIVEETFNTLVDQMDL
ncbi:Uncharacterized protein YrzB, UPF0473 family [Halolactibacillus halophilus]|uniref:UPF0473 protein HHA03_00740 n=1 Tax=Halolactibacillus halophilus TaxID=306540 RepID=A0A1I5KX97_9BACI|nr:DUF1292 domain-containing protein [Halolactibacillus halophilus]GEM00542.1 UPF0473 protein YrzB [Halolactibacillus halophilus]SFO89573.1 Uncharacterized protein YrzB, UPF0473 family [Halolactibacillus halophilus]